MDTATQGESFPVDWPGILKPLRMPARGECQLTIKEPVKLVETRMEKTAMGRKKDIGISLLSKSIVGGKLGFPFSRSPRLANGSAPTRLGAGGGGTLLLGFRFGFRSGGFPRFIGIVSDVPA